MKIDFVLNGRPVTVEAPASLTLLKLLRDGLGLVGSKPGCEIGECGACSVLIDGEVVNACLTLAPQVHGRTVVTIEGIHAPDGGPNDLQMALVEQGAVQCGYCTPGMVMQAAWLLSENPEPTEAEIRLGISGNLCRCTGYQNIVKSIEEAAKAMRSEAKGKR